MNHLAKSTLALILVFSILIPTQAVTAANPKNIILLIGDGMGISQITAGKIVAGNLSLESFKKIGFQTTWSKSHLVTDSAAAATALATGHKTENYHLGLSPENETLKNVVEWAEENNKATGIVSTSIVTHATPGGFTTHVKHRNMYSDIARQQIKANLEVMFGGGLKYFRNTKQNENKEIESPNLVSVLRQRMPVVSSMNSFRKLGKTRSAAAFLAEKHLPPATERNYSLGELTKKAIEILHSNDSNGFFLMVEGSQIDMACHNNDSDRMIAELLDFDTAVSEAIEFARTNPETLIVVTGDHETGGYSILDGNLKEKKISKLSFGTDQHSADMIPVFSSGPGSDMFTGFFDNTHIGKTLINLVKQD
jgi:alkaline phosphatase